MNMTFGNPSLSERWKPAGQVALTAVFEDSVTCTRVKEFCQSLARDLGERSRIVQHVWAFSTLRMTELQVIAAEEAAAADLVIIATRQAESLPEEVKSWIEKWLRQKGARRTVLLALLDRGYDGATGPIRAYLQEVAARGGLELRVELREGA